MLNLPDVPRTYPEHLVNPMTDDDWAAIERSYVETSKLIPTQEGVSFEHIIKYLNGVTPNKLARVVKYDGKYFLHDGHHRWLIALIQGDALMFAKVVNLDDR